MGSEVNQELRVTRKEATLDPSRILQGDFLFTHPDESDMLHELLTLKKYSSLVFIWALSVVSTWVPSSASLTDADPTDDFSFTLEYSSKAELYHFMSEEAVSEVLSDRLDLFPKSQTPRLAHHILGLCKRFRLDPAFVLSLIQVESSFRVKATSPVGAVGLMQVMISTANDVIREEGLPFSGNEPFKGYSLIEGHLNPAQLADPFVNTAIGIAYLARLRDYYKGFSPYYVLAAYNVGPTRMDELLDRKSFKPVETKKYFLAIRRRVPEFRYYRRYRS